MTIADLILKNGAPILVLSYFDSLIGPNPFQIYPENLKEYLKNDILQNIASHMDVHKENDIFQVCYGKEKINSLSLIFAIRSEWARGMHEVCMVSLLDMGCNNLIDTYGEFIENFKDQFVKNEDAFKAFYVNSFSKLRTHPEIKDVHQQINALLKDFYDSLLKMYEKNKNMGGCDGAN